MRSTQLVVVGAVLAVLSLSGCPSTEGGTDGGGTGSTDSGAGGGAGADAGAGGGSDGGTRTDAGAGDAGNTTIDRDGGGPDPLPEPTTDPSSYSLIDLAVSNGTLTEDQGALYKLYVDFGSADLPPQYKGDDIGLLEGLGGQQFAEYVARVGEANVPSATIEAARPYFVPPYYEGSWWNRSHPSATKRPSNPTCRAWSAPCELLTEWHSLAGTHVVVWYESRFELVDGPRAASLVAELDNTIWPKLTGLMGTTPLSDVGTGVISETDSRLDVVLMELPAAFEGQTYSLGMGCKATPAVVYLNRSLPSHGLEAQAAHEMMHAIQFALPVKAQCLSKYTTMIDATAVWATNFVYPTNDWEHRYSTFYLHNDWFEQPYDVFPGDSNKGFAYGAWLWPFYLSTTYGPTVIKSMWDATTSYNEPLAAMDGALIGFGSHFAKEWPDFVAANWNQDTIDTYRKADRITEFAQLDSSHDLTFAMGSGGIGTTETNASVEHAAATYYRIAINDSTARTFNVLNGWSFKRTTADPGFGPMLAFDGLSVTDRHGAALQVFMKVDGSWQAKPVDLTNVPWLTSCRNDPAGKVEELIFMFSNGEISSSATNYDSVADRGDPSGIQATTVACRDWTGALSMTLNDGTVNETLTITGATLKNATPTAIATPGGEPTTYPLTAGQQVPIGYGYPYKLTAGNVTWSYHSTTSSCTNDGMSTTTLSEGLPSHMFGGYAPMGLAAHNVSFTSFLGLLNLYTINWSCTDSNGKVTTGTTPHATQLDVTVAPDNAAVRVSTSGTSITGTGAETGDSMHTTGTWSLTASP